MGTKATKMIKNRKYLYYVIYEDGKQKAKYCGLASKPESEKKALDFEISELKNKKEIIIKKIKISELKRMKI